jgi:hypothetical protein
MSLEYIRQHYGVPAYEGTEITYTWPHGQRHGGTIVGAADNGNAHLMVSLPGLYDEPVPMHPTWAIEYPVVVGGGSTP